jgi:hypothetical protein
VKGYKELNIEINILIKKGEIPFSLKLYRIQNMKKNVTINFKQLC